MFVSGWSPKREGRNFFVVMKSSPKLPNHSKQYYAYINISKFDFTSEEHLHNLTLNREQRSVEKKILQWQFCKVKIVSFIPCTICHANLSANQKRCTTFLIRKIMDCYWSRFYETAGSCKNLQVNRAKTENMSFVFIIFFPMVLRFRLKFSFLK